jgi:hypothetical protein
VADSRRRAIWSDERPDWNLGKLLDLARSLAAHDPVLVGIDVALGVPAGYWSQVTEQPPWRSARTFLDWLSMLDPSSGFFETTPTAESWRVDRPFFHIPRGEGSLTAYKEKIEGGLLRRIDSLVRAKPIFAVSGIPGTVGSGTRDLWMELTPLLTADRDFAVWPFEGDLERVLATRPITLAETYPGLAYAAALAPALPSRRITISKTKRDARELVCDALERVSWANELETGVGDLVRARADEDAFDSHLTAAAVLRCVIEGVPLYDPRWVDRTAEGAILLAGPVDPWLKSRGMARRGRPSLPPASQAPLELTRPGSSPAVSSAAQSPRTTAPKYTCPIDSCERVFSGSRGGWDAHVASLRMHPKWHPGVRDPEERKRLFRLKFAEWFSSRTSS